MVVFHLLVELRRQLAPQAELHHDAPNRDGADHDQECERENGDDGIFII